MHDYAQKPLFKRKWTTALSAKDDMTKATGAVNMHAVSLAPILVLTIVSQ